MLNHLNHKHCIIKGNCERTPKTEVELNLFLTRVVERVGMKIFAGPWAKECLTCGNEGMTGAVIIETSHCVIHFWNVAPTCAQAYFQFDLYSCADFNIADVVAMLETEWLATGVQVVLLDRNNRLQVINHSDRSESVVWGPSELLYWGT